MSVAPLLWMSIWQMTVLLAIVLPLQKMLVRSPAARCAVLSSGLLLCGLCPILDFVASSAGLTSPFSLLPSAPSAFLTMDRTPQLGENSAARQDSLVPGQSTSFPFVPLLASIWTG